MSTATVINSDATLAGSKRPVPQLSPDEIIGNCKILSLVGKGAFASVYLAEDLSLGRKVALKVSFLGQGEARTLAQLDHENIIQVYSQFEVPEKELFVISMQYVPSISLQDLIPELKLHPAKTIKGNTVLSILARRTRNDEFVMDLNAFSKRQKLLGYSHKEWVVSVGVSLARALAVAHSRRVLHLDIKPANILLRRDGRPFLVDFNVSVEAGILKDGTIPENFGGTFHYMPPEQRAVFKSEDRKTAIQSVDERSDIYSLCRVLLVMMVIGQVPRDDSGTVELIERGMNDSPALRFQSAEELARTLHSHLKSLSIRRRLPPINPIIRTIARRHPLMALTCLGAIPQIAAGLFGYLYNKAEILGDLVEPERILFSHTNLVYTSVIYTGAMIVWFTLLKRLNENLRTAPTPRRWKICVGCGDSFCASPLGSDGFDRVLVFGCPSLPGRFVVSRRG